MQNSRRCDINLSIHYIDISKAKRFHGERNIPRDAQTPADLSAYLKGMPESSGINISATALAAGLHIWARCRCGDLALVSSGGRPKIGYNRAALVADIEQFLGYGNTNDAVLIGAGKLWPCAAGLFRLCGIRPQYRRGV